ncbi:MAG: rhodanese-like domain-containing protein [Candidatus Thermoplasmatota archaeon]|nr:rhodanese-like domain-containing protein [Candidatus Thermoplasmatota archaeon]
MNKNLKMESLTTLLILVLLINSLNLFASSEIIEIENYKDTSSSLSNMGYTNITVQEAWLLLTNTSNGIQVPIDVRTDPEWMFERIDTPSPENPRHHCVCEWDNETIVQEFMDLYTGEEIILYCVQGFRSFNAVNILIDHGFVGTIYNMPGGINGWINAGYPTKKNQAPEKPTITGKHRGKTGEEYYYFISAIDPEGGDVFYYINWSDGSETLYMGPCSSGEEVQVSHVWLKEKTFTIQVIAYDELQAKSDMATFEVSMPKARTLFYHVPIFLEMMWEFFLTILNTPGLN